MRIGVYGGSFNPPHLGHVFAAKAAVDALALDRLIVIPTGAPPHKSLPDGSPEGETRLQMTRMAFRDIPKAEISDLEIVKSGISYTADTMAALKSGDPCADFYLIMGADMFLSLESWYKSAALLRSVVPVVLARREDDRAALEAYAARLTALSGARPVILENEIIPISSSELRASLRRREKSRYMDDTIYRYIIRKRLYGAKPEFAWLREQARLMLAPGRVPHVLGCEEEAVSLARHWGADEDEAREAGILHDITKKLDLTEQLRICDQYGMMIDMLERSEAKLLHSKTGAAIAHAEFGVSSAVFDAIMWHTTGRTGMSLLEKIVYMADYIEPERSFDGVAMLRRLAYEDLDRAVCAGLRMSIEDMEARGIIPHPRTLEALKFLEK